MTDKSVDALPVAITTSYVYSVAVFFGLEGMDFFWDLATLIDIMLVGYWLEMKSRMAASRALESLVALLPAVVDVERDNQVTDIALKDLRSGDILLIKPGEKTPADGMILEGSSYMNESMLTGKSVPVQKKEDDKVARWLTLVSITVGVLTFAVWFSGRQSLSFALERMVTVMLTSCPHALGVAISLVIAISTTFSIMYIPLESDSIPILLARSVSVIKHRPLKSYMLIPTGKLMGRSKTS